MAFPPPDPELAVPSRPLADDVVALRAFAPGDVEWIVKACRDPEIPRFTLVPDPYEEADARGWLGMHADNRASGEALQLAIVEAVGGAPLGSIGLMRIAWDRCAARSATGSRRGPVGAAPRRAPCACWRRMRSARPGCSASRSSRTSTTPRRSAWPRRRAAGARACSRSYFLAHGVRHDCVMYALLPDDL